MSAGDGSGGSVQLPTTLQMAVDIAVLKNTALDHEKRLDKLEGRLWWILFTALVSAISGVGSLSLLLLSHATKQ